MNRQRTQVSLVLLSVLLAACATPAPALTPTQLPKATETPSPALIATPIQTPTVTSSPTPTLVPLSDVIEGASILTEGGDLTDRARQYLFAQQLQPLGINWVGLVVYCYQESPTSIQIDCQDATTSDAELLKRAELAHRLGLRVMLHPQLITLSGDFPIVNHGGNEQAWEQWFKNYITSVTHYAQLAERLGADLFVIGNEMYGITQREADWRKVAAAVRQVYSGRITYAAHVFDVFSVAWWDAVDVIGVNAYFPLTQYNDPTLGELKNAWVPIVSQLEELSRKWNKPILITEIGYPAIDGANYWGGYIDPFCGNLHSDLQEQADLHEALLSSFEGKSWWIGVFWWAWDGNPEAGGPYDLLGGPQGKPAEDVLRRHYGGLPRPTATPITDVLVDPTRQLVVYHDTLAPEWTMSDWTTATTELGYREDRYSGEAAIRVTVDNSYLEFVHLPAVDLSRYDLLEFYVKFTRGTPPFLSVRVANWSPEFYEDSSVAVGAYFAPAENGWSRVRVPFSELFRADVISGRKITELGLVFNGYCPAYSPPYSEILFDEIRFVGAARP